MQALESVGPTYSIEKMKEASRLSRDALLAIAEQIKPGMSEEEATKIAKTELASRGADKNWHKPLVRFGVNTLKAFSEPSQPGVILQEKDVFFLDIGPVWDWHEGDVGQSFAVGGDPELEKLAQASREIWELVKNRWREGQSGAELYQFAKETIERAGYVFVEEIQGHRLGDFPHSAKFRSASLGEQAYLPVSGAWVLEIQIRHPTRNLGAFFEDLLV